MFCPKCGKQLRDGVKFCTGCGYHIDPNRQAPAPQAAAQQPPSAPSANPAPQQSFNGDTPTTDLSMQQPSVSPQPEYQTPPQPSAQPPYQQQIQQPESGTPQPGVTFNVPPTTQQPQQPQNLPNAYNAPGTTPGAQSPAAAPAAGEKQKKGKFERKKKAPKNNATSKFGDKKKPIIIAAAAVVVVAVVLFLVFGTGGFVAKKGSVNDYSWSDLSKISSKISQAGNENSALEIAKKYNLVGSDGKLTGNETKSFKTTDGTEVQAQITGFYHDDKESGGKAGITFITKGCIAEHSMNSTDTNAGGWERSSLRSWLNSDIDSKLPDELESKIVSVKKKSNNTGATSNTSAVTTTTDKLWLYSSTELCGSVSWYSVNASEKAFDTVLNAEGAEYQLFKDQDVSSTKSNTSLVKQLNGQAKSWYTRSASPKHNTAFYVVSQNGTPSSGQMASGTGGVAYGFCI